MRTTLANACFMPRLGQNQASFALRRGRVRPGLREYRFPRPMPRRQDATVKEPMSAPESRFVKACRSISVDRTPVWFMRQAGRYLPEYRELRGDRDILETCKHPEQVVEITLQPLLRMELDAAIVFSDIMVPLAGVGVDVRIEPGRGPVVDTPIRGADD